MDSIQDILQHRFPFVFVDKIIEFNEEKKSIIGLKNVTINEPFFQGHFPENPIFPGVLLVEALAQVSAILAMNLINTKLKQVYLAKINDMRFLKQVVPGDSIFLYASQVSLKFGIGIFEVHVKVNDETVCQGSITAKVDSN